MEGLCVELKCSFLHWTSRCAVLWAAMFANHKKNLDFIRLLDNRCTPHHDFDSETAPLAPALLVLLSVLSSTPDAATALESAANAAEASAVLAAASRCDTSTNPRCSLLSESTVLIASHSCCVVNQA